MSSKFLFNFLPLISLLDLSMQHDTNLFILGVMGLWLNANNDNDENNDNDRIMTMMRMIWYRYTWKKNSNKIYTKFIHSFEAISSSLI